MSDFDKLFKNLNHFFFIKIRKIRFTSKAQFFTIGSSQFSIKKPLFFIYQSVFTNRGTTAPV